MSARVVCAHPACNRSYESKAFMLQHYTDSHSPPQLQQAASTPSKKRAPCKHCNKSFSTAAALDQHFVDVHLSKQLLSNTKLGSSSGAAAHDDDDVAPPILQEPVEVACNDCGKTFKTTDALHQHQWDSAEHTLVSRRRVPNYVSECSQCDKKFSTANDLEQHFVDQHPLSEVPESDEHCTWQHVADRFHLAWKKPSASLHRIHRVFKVYNPGWRRKGYEEYRKELKKDVANKKVVKLGAEEDINVRNKVLYNGNELKRYHGTKVRCGLGQQAQSGAVIKGGSLSSSLCSDPGCSLCRILQSGFKTSKCKMDKFQRFGRGIYCSSISSKADDYVCCSCSCSLHSNHQNGGIDRSCRVMMMCKVLAGRLYRSTHNLQGLHSPPRGFHSVQGDPGGQVLNYDELVVYDDRAILPEYIIIYS